MTKIKEEIVFEVPKDKILIDYNDLKIKHLSGEYVNLPFAPEPDDILFWAKSKKKTIFTSKDLIKIFGTERLENIEKTMEWLDFNNFTKILEKYPEIDLKSEHWFFHSETECYMKMIWEEWIKSDNPELHHIGISITDKENEGENLHKKEKAGETVSDGSVMVIKYEIINNGAASKS